MKVADMHCDTLAELWYTHWEGAVPSELIKNNLHIDLEKMQKGDYLLQNFAVFVNLDRKLDPLESALYQIDIFYQEMAKNSDIIRPVKAYADIEKNQKDGIISGVLSVEEGAVCKGRPEFLRILYQLGVRMMTLTWNHENELAYPNNVPTDASTVFPCGSETTMGLKEKGYLFIEEMERLGMVIDVSHLSDAGFYQILQNTKRPFAASHSNARSLCRHCRNLSDDMIQKLGNRGGVIGLNYCGSFLEEGADDQNCKSTVSRMAEHARHITNLGGMECLGLGSDFDGISHNLEMKDCSMLPLLEASLKKAGFLTSDIEKIFYRNVLNLYKEVWK